MSVYSATKFGVRGIAESLDADPEVIPGFEEYSADALLTNAGFPDRDPSLTRREHFRRLRGILLDWSAGKVEGAETWEDFNTRVRSRKPQARGQRFIRHSFVTIVLHNQLQPEEAAQATQVPH